MTHILIGEVRHHPSCLYAIATMARLFSGGRLPVPEASLCSCGARP